MKFGYFVAILCFVLALVFGGFSYWDMQDGYYSAKLLYLSIFMGVMCVAFLLFPGGHTTFQEAAKPDSGHTFQTWKATTPVLHRRVWLGAVLLSIYLSFWANSWLAGESFFTVFHQLSILAAAGLLWLFLRKKLRQM